MTDQHPARPTTIHVHADHRVGLHPTGSEDFIDWWLPTLGPTATLAARLLAASVTATPAATWSTHELAGLLGLGGNQYTLWRALDRLTFFHVMAAVGADTFTIRLEMPALRAGQVDRHPHGDRYPTRCEAPQ